jgi:diguanylate cyclase (GGDEF)-like protein
MLSLVDGSMEQTAYELADGVTPCRGGHCGDRQDRQDRQDRRAALGAALAARVEDITAACQRRYHEANPAVDLEDVAKDPLWHVTSLATAAIARWLQTGEAADATERAEIASVGHAAAHQNEVGDAERPGEPSGRASRRQDTIPPTSDRVPGQVAGASAPAPDRKGTSAAGSTRRPSRQLSVTLITKLNFWWSDTTCAALAEEAARLGVPGDIVAEATTMVVKSCQASLVDMAKRYDAELSSLQERLAHLALHDALTGLANRAVLVERLERALARLARHPVGLAAVFIDVDNFKVVNDVLGHAAGDAVLVETARRLCAQVRPEDLVARMGGDEFVVLFEDLADPVADGQRMAERLRAAVGAPMTVDGQPLYLTISAGVAAVSATGCRSEEVLAEADSAMYRVKRAGRNSVAVVEVGNGPTPVRFAMASGLHQALERDELRLLYQPVCDSRDGSVVGFEALLRWEHPERGTIPPLDFIPVAEESGLMVAIGKWVLHEACRQAVAWGVVLGGVPRMAVNVSGRQLDDPAFVGEVASVLAATGMPADALMLEITESILLGDRCGYEEVLTALKELGVHLSIDDFGTGYSSLAYLRRFPVDQLKVDRAFVQDVSDHGDTRIMEAVVRLAHDLGLEVVAEGVETTGELDTVKALGCDVVQGYLLGRPVPATCVDHGSCRAVRAG